MRFLLFLIFLASPALAEPTFKFDCDWRGERIELPPSFAPTLGWKGVETIRFAPGMFEAGSESFFSYALVFLLAPDSDVSKAGIEREVLTYYQGLATAVMRGKPVDTEKFTFAATAVDDSPDFTGVLKWVEPFSTQAAQTLNLEIHLWKHGEQPAIFFSVSPQPVDHEIWTELRRIRESFRFED